MFIRTARIMESAAMCIQANIQKQWQPIVRNMDCHCCIGELTTNTKFPLTYGIHYNGAHHIRRDGEGSCRMPRTAD